jgi:hypothetical protein
MAFNDDICQYDRGRNLQVKKSASIIRSRIGHSKVIDDDVPGILR